MPLPMTNYNVFYTELYVAHDSLWCTFYSLEIPRNWGWCESCAAQWWWGLEAAGLRWMNSLWRMILAEVSSRLPHVTCISLCCFRLTLLLSVVMKLHLLWFYFFYLQLVSIFNFLITFSIHNLLKCHFLTILSCSLHSDILIEVSIFNVLVNVLVLAS